MRLLYLILLNAFAGNTYAQQDTIREISGKMMPANIKSVGEFDVRYNREPGQKAKSTGRTLVMSKSRIAELIYANGLHKDVLPAHSSPTDSGGKFLDKEDFYRLGANDAKLYYNGYHGAANGTFLATFPGSPALGLIVAVATSMTPPKPKRFTYPNPSFATDPDYTAGYTAGAKKIKNNKVWANWLAGTITTVVTVLFLRNIFPGK